MATIKIKELPVKSYNGISGEDIMVIEDKNDTKQITVQDLQLFFSSDIKLTALKETMEASLAELEKNFNNKLKEMISDDNTTKKQLTDLYNDHERTKARLGDLIEKVTDLENLLNDTIERVEKNELSISNLQTYTKQIRTDLDKAITRIDGHDKKISNIEEKDKEQDLRFEVNEISFNELKEAYEKKIVELDKTINEDRDTAKNYSDQLYDQIMKYIDYYHHYHEDPPNFDDPNGADTKQMNLIYKVGTIYETNIEDFKPEENLPGTWEFIGFSNIYGTDGSVKMKKYIYVRTI